MEMISPVGGEAIPKNLSPEGLTLFNSCMNELTAGLKTLLDKPDETALTTLSALWHAAAGQPLSVQRVMLVALPELDQGGIARLRRLLRDRIGGAPLPYLTGRQQFMGVELLVTDAALIPREETALLGNAALLQLRAIVREKGHATVIDVCTGSGNLALALAVHEPAARVWAADLSEVAVALARRNLAQLDLSDRVEFRSGDLLAPFDTPEFHGRVDLLVCNPPYISSSKVDGMPTEISQYEPRLAFDGGPLGIRILFRLIAEAPRYLRRGGWLAFEVGLGQGPGIRKKIEKCGDYIEVTEIVNKSGQTRALLARLPLMDGAFPGMHKVADGGEFVVVVAHAIKAREIIFLLWRSGLDNTHLPEIKFNWYYQRNPSGVPDTLFLRHSGDRDAVGVAAVGHRRMRFNARTFLTGVMVDFVVRPEHRTLFPALFLQREMRRFALKTHQLIWALPNLRATAVFGRAGYQCVGEMVRYVRVVRSAEYLARQIPRWISRTIGPMIDWARLVEILLRGLGSRGYETQWQDRPDARFNELWERSDAPEQLMGVRDQEYLTWRFIDTPFCNHMFFTLVSTFDQRLIGYAACEFSKQAMHVSDFLVDSNVPSACSNLWHELTRECYRRGCASLTTEFLGSERVKRVLKDAGLIARDRSPLFAAVDDEAPPILHERHWYITRGDVDG